MLYNKFPEILNDSHGFHYNQNSQAGKDYFSMEGLSNKLYLYWDHMSKVFFRVKILYSEEELHSSSLILDSYGFHMNVILHESLFSCSFPDAVFWLVLNNYVSNKSQTRSLQDTKKILVFDKFSTKHVTAGFY
jgi:hypothetical protein